MVVAGFYDWASGQKKESDLPAQSGNWVNVHNGKQVLH